MEAVLAPVDQAYEPPEGLPVAVIDEEVPEQMVGLVTVKVGV